MFMQREEENVLNVKKYDCRKDYIRWFNIEDFSIKAIYENIINQNCFSPNQKHVSAVVSPNVCF